MSPAPRSRRDATRAAMARSTTELRREQRDRGEHQTDSNERRRERERPFGRQIVQAGGEAERQENAEHKVGTDNDEQCCGGRREPAHCGRS